MHHHIRLFLTLLLIINVSTIATGSAIRIKNEFEVRIAIVDVQYVLESSVAIQSIRKEVERFNQEIQQEMSTKETELKKIEDELIKKRHAINAELFEKDLTKFNKKVNEAQKAMQLKKTRLERAHAEAMGKVHEATINIISNMAKKYNLNLVLPSTQILFAKNNLNITAEVINQLNNKLRHVKVSY